MKISAGRREAQLLGLSSIEWSLRSVWDKSVPSVRVKYLALRETAANGNSSLRSAEWSTRFWWIRRPSASASRIKENTQRVRT
jgi:hypothetical protein